MGEQSLKVALDVHYDDDRDFARAAAVVFADYADAQPLRSHALESAGAAPYVPGEFYLRELPCLLPLLETIRSVEPTAEVIVDGFVDLAEGRPGLGRRLLAALAAPEGCVVIGVAKSPFQGAPATPILRGRSKKPLWVSSSGSAELAARAISAMHGRDRLPTLLRLVDRIAKGLEPASS